MDSDPHAPRPFHLHGAGRFLVLARELGTATTGDQDEVTKDSGGRAADHCPGSATLARYSGR